MMAASVHDIMLGNLRLILTPEDGSDVQLRRGEFTTRGTLKDGHLGDGTSPRS